MNIRQQDWQLPTLLANVDQVGDCQQGKVKMATGVGRNAMSGEHNVDESVETDASTDSINRRRFVKSLSAAGGASIFGGMSIGSASAKNSQSEPTLPGVPEADFELIDTDIKTGTEAQSLVDAVMEFSEMNDLVSHIEQDSNLTVDTSTSLKIDVHTSDEKFNAYDPALGIVPFGRDESTTQTLSGQSSQHDAGLLFVLTVVEQGTRGPVFTFGLTSKSKQSQESDGISTNSSDGYEITSHVLNEGTPVKAKQQTISAQQLGNPQPTPQGLIACSACQTFIDALLFAGGRVVGQYACVASCVAIFSVNLPATYGCAAICSTAFNVIAAVGAGAGGSVVCNELSDRSPINFC